jgi:Flp pilus assembly protein TadB
MLNARARKQALEKARAPSFEGALPCCEAFQPRLIPAAILAALASPRGIGPKVNSLSGYFFLVFLAAFFLAILLFRIGLDLVAFLARIFFLTGIGTSSS